MILLLKVHHLCPQLSEFSFCFTLMGAFFYKKETKTRAILLSGEIHDDFVSLLSPFYLLKALRRGPPPSATSLH